MKLHHIGIVVPNIEKSLGEITKFLKFQTIGIPTNIGSQKVNVCFLNAGNINIELIEPAEKNSPISNFVYKGGGFHHMCFEVKDIHKELSRIINQGGRLIVEPVKGFEERLIAFVMLNMKNTNCNLIELVEEKITLQK